MTDINPGKVFDELSLHATDFTVHDRHLKLIQHMYVEWNSVEFGAPTIDPKRPYGSSGSRVLHDVAKHTDADTWGLLDDDDQYNYVQEYAEELANLHAETGIALQIVLRHGFRTGRYRRSNAWSVWEPAGDTRPAQFVIDRDVFVELVEHFFLKLGFAAPETVPERLSQFRSMLLTLANDSAVPEDHVHREPPITTDRLAEIRDLNVDSCSGDAPHNPDVWELEKARTDLLALVDWLEGGKS